jgi:hypothetical protein
MSESTLSDEQLEAIKTLLCSEDEADRQQAGERLLAAEVTELDFEACEGLMDVGLSQFAGLPNLTALNLWACEGITDAGLSEVSGLTTLKTLSLGGTIGDGFTDAGLSKLCSLTKLTSFTLTNCSGLTDTRL